MQKFLLSASAILMSTGIFADSITIDRWLLVNSLEIKMPLFHETENIRGKTFQPGDLFSFSPVDAENIFPEENKLFPWPGSDLKRWVQVNSNDSGYTEIAKNGNMTHETAYLAVYLTAGRWIKAGLEIESRQRLEVFLNGERLGSKTSTEAAGKEPGRFRHDADLTTGKHLLLIRTFHEDGEESLWQVRTMINLPGYAGPEDITAELDPRQGKTINHLLDGVKAGAAGLSYDGTLYSVNYSRTLPPSDRSESWTEIKRVSDGRLIHSLRHATISSFSWAPHSNIFSYRTTREGKSTIWIHDMDRGSYYALLEETENLGSYSWSPDGSFIVYSLREDATAEEGDLKRLLGMQDRLPGYRTRNFLYRVDIASGKRERLTHGYLTTSLHDISPGGKKILFSQSRPDYLERPYSKQDLFIMDLESRHVDTIFSGLRWGVSGVFSPDGKRLLLTGGPSSFGSLGENIPEGMIANNYDKQAYIHDPESGMTDPITREFNPSVSQALWSKTDNNIYLVAGDEDYVRLFRYNPSNRRFSRIDTGEDVINRISIAANAPHAVYSGSGMSSPPKISLLNLRNGRFRELENPDRENFRHVQFGENRKWDFISSEGLRIPGRVYLPPGFNESQKYPVIVYYYGGTNPVTRSFGGRYPFNMYAARGYIVYVLQPSGATGFGQEFAAMHVNNWGVTVAGEIIEGTRRFLEDHPFADPERVGCMGASYGGFMTMLLLTQTDIYAAAISHAGISSISSYWGEGYWGYGYSAEASAESFPWNNPELYVGQSPLFSADRISTPLLLLHGSADTNVPVGESIQLYVALTLLGRPVELVSVEGEDHHVLTYSKRLGWSDTKLAWFDRWLKDQPQWWDNIYPEKNF